MHPFNNLFPPSSSFHNASGNIPYRMTNDYMFRAILQTNNFALKGLICSLLHLSEEEIISVTITNPIELGKYIDEKDFQLDIRVCLNNTITINLEMQVSNQYNWPERSLCYLCRTFSSLEKGENYRNKKPAIHIGFLDFSLPNFPSEFYSTYYMMNSKNHHIYSDKFRLSVVNLTQIKLATKTDKAYHIDEWASAFKASTWEELKMLSAKNPYLSEKAYNEILEKLDIALPHEVNYPNYPEEFGGCYYIVIIPHRTLY